MRFSVYLYLAIALISTIHSFICKSYRLYRGNSNKVHRLKMVSNSVDVDWSFLDAVYLITTTQTELQRLEKTKKELEKVNLLNDKLKIRVFKPDDEDRVRGCYISHIKVLQEIQKESKKRKNFKALVLEDNLEVTLSMNSKIIRNVNEFLRKNDDWDVFHLAYMMYVPGLSLKKLRDENIVQMTSDAGSSIGTTAYIISNSGVDTILEYNKNNKNIFKEAIPNVMAQLFPSSRYASYPMIFHRAAKIGSLVNPQLDDFRRVMFNPYMYTTWEKLMVTTGLQNNQLFPTLLISLLISFLSVVYDTIQKSTQPMGISSSDFSIQQMFETQIYFVILIPLAIGLWGASLFKPGNTGKGFASSTQQKNS